MANLTEISIVTRKTLIFLIIAAVIFFILRFFVSFGIQYYRAQNQAPPPPPDVRFGKLPKPVFPKDAKNSRGLTFTLLNIEGKPPETTASGKVYYLPKKFPTFESGERAKNLAKKLGFMAEPEIQTTYYHYTDDTDRLHTLSIDSVYLNFQLKYDYVSNPQIFSGQTITSRDDTINQVKNFAQNQNLVDDTLLTGKITTDLLKYDLPSQKLIEAQSLSETQAIRVNFFRNDMDELKLVTPEFRKSYNYVIFAPATNRNLRNILTMSYIFWPIANNEFATYPLISATAAFQTLGEGRATVIEPGNNEENIVIRNIYLSYYDNSEPQLYMQPIFVFEGDNNFVAYYPAISPDWLE